MTLNMASAAIKRATLLKPPVETAPRIRSHDNEPSRLVSTSHVKAGAKLYGVRQTVDGKKVTSLVGTTKDIIGPKPEKVRQTAVTKKVKKTEPQTQAIRKPPLPLLPLAARARQVSSAAPQNKPSHSSTKPVSPARPLHPRTRRVSSIDLSSARSLLFARGPKANELNATKSSVPPRQASQPLASGSKASEPNTRKPSLPPRKASLLAIQQVRHNLNEMRRPLEKPPVTHAEVIRHSLIPVKRSTVTRSSSRLEDPFESQNREILFLPQVRLEKLHIQDLNTSYKVEELGSEGNQFVLTPLRGKSDVLGSEGEDKGPSTPVSRVSRSESGASCEQTVDKCDETPSHRENNSSMHARNERSGRKSLSEKFAIVTPSALKRDRDVTFETEVRPKLKRQRFMVTLPFHFEENVDDTDNTQFFTPEKVSMREVVQEKELELVEQVPEELVVVPCENDTEEMEETRDIELETVPCSDQNGELEETREITLETGPCQEKETEQTPSDWRCIVM